MPPGERKSGIPDSVEMPAPVKATMRLAEPIMSRSRSISSMSVSYLRSRCRHGRIVHGAAGECPALASHLDGIGEHRAGLGIDAAPLVDHDGELRIVGRRIAHRATELLRPAMGDALHRLAAAKAQHHVARGDLEAPRRLAAATAGADPFALVEPFATAGGLDRRPAQLERADARPRPGLASAVKLDEHRTTVLAGRQAAQRPRQFLLGRAILE